jgi:hypothetical protein
MNPEPWDVPGNHGEFDQRLRASCRFQVGNISLDRLWTYYFGIGGNADELALEAYLNELLTLTPGQMQLVDTALKELSSNGRTEPAGQ